MGYRSEVDVVFYVPTDSDTAYPLLKLWFDANYPHIEAKDEWCASIDYDEENRAIIVNYSDVKWYGAYDHVSAVEKALSQIDTMLTAQPVTSVNQDPDPDYTPFEIAYEFVRLGEEDNDIEIEASSNADIVIAVNRSTEISFTNRRPV